MFNSNSKLSRRTFLNSLGVAYTLLIYNSRELISPNFAYATKQNKKLSFGPINYNFDKKTAPKFFFGDENPDKRHQGLWNKSEYIKQNGGIPASSEHHKLVTIGAGIGGLLSSYLLKKYKPIILEQASRLGGNSKGQTWKGIPYSLGAAYFIKPEPNTDINRLVKELELDKIWTIKSTEDPVVINQSIFNEFWDGKTSKISKKQCKRIKKYFLSVYNENNGSIYPEIPYINKATKDEVNRLDRISFYDHVREVANEELYSDVEVAIEHYCWSSFNASAKEISAASGVNFFASEFGEIAILPGGNSKIAEKLVEKLVNTLPENSLRPSSIVIDVEVKSDFVQICYIDKMGNLKTVTADSVIMACPKFIVEKVLNDLEPERSRAISNIKYRSYLVANVLINRVPRKSFYDLYLLGDGTLYPGNTKESSDHTGATDIILANYAHSNSHHNPNYSVLTLYRPIPYDNARSELLASDAYERFSKAFQDQINNDILPFLGLKTEWIEEVRIARWGHPFPVALPGFISDGNPEILKKPFKEKVFFVEQDNWALPAFETSATEAFEVARQIRKSGLI